MFCGQCGKQIDETSIFCPYCGAPQNAPSQTAQPHTTPAQTAQPQNIPQQSFQPQSTSFQNTQPQSSPQQVANQPAQAAIQEPAQEGKPSKAKAIIGIAVAVIVVAIAIGVAVVYLLPKPADTTANAAANTSAEATATENADEEATQEAAQESTATEPQEQAYRVTTVSKEVSVPQLRDQDNERRVVTWTYPQIECQVPNAPIDKINSDLVTEFNDDAQAMESLTADEFQPGDSDPIIVKKDAEVTYLSDSLACVYVHQTGDAGGNHGIIRGVPMIYNLETGEKISAAEAFDMEETDLADRAREDIRYYLTNIEPSDVREVSDAVEDCVQKGFYYISGEGIVLETPEYGLGSYGYGSRTLVIVPFDDESLEGTAVDPQPYVEPTF